MNREFEQCLCRSQGVPTYPDSAGRISKTARSGRFWGIVLDFAATCWYGVPKGTVGG